MEVVGNAYHGGIRCRRQVRSGLLLLLCVVMRSEKLLVNLVEGIFLINSERHLQLTGNATRAEELFFRSSCLAAVQCVLRILSFQFRLT